MGNRLMGIAFTNTISENELLKQLDIPKIKNKRKVSFEEMTSDFLSQYSFGVYNSNNGTIIFTDEKLMTNDILLKKLSKKGNSIGFYIYDTTSTYCYDLYKNSEHITKNWKSTTENSDFESENFGVSNLNSKDDYSENIFEIISSIINEPFDEINLNTECALYDFSPENYNDEPISKSRAEEILSNILKEIFLSEGFKFVKSRDAFVKKTKENEFELYFGNISGMIDNKNGLAIKMSLGLGVKNKQISKEFKKIAGEEIYYTNHANLETILLSNDDLFGNSYKFRNASDLFDLANNIKVNFQSKILPFFDNYSKYENVLNHYLKHNINRHKYSIQGLEYLELGLFCAVKKNREDLITLYSKRKDDINIYSKLVKN